MNEKNGIDGIKILNPFLGNTAAIPKNTPIIALKIDRIVQNERAVSVHWTDGHISEFHYMWLRHNCFCTGCGNSSDGIRSITILDVPAGISPVSIELNGDRLQVTWRDQHPSEYSASWLRANCYAETSRQKRLSFKPTLWRASEIIDQFPTVDYHAACDDELVRLDMFEKLRDYGIVRIDNVGSDPDDTERLANLVGPIHETTVYGYVYDVQVEAVSKLGAKTAIHQDPHHDDAFYYNHPGVDVFHCLINEADSGGESTYCDGFAIAEAIRLEAPQAFELLSTVPIQHNRRHPGEIDLRIHAPLIRLDWNGSVSGVRYFDRAMAPLDLPSHLIESMYEAVREYHQRMVSAEFKVEIKVPPGTGMLIDNQRAMHGRNAFRTDSGRRIRLCHVPRDEFHGRLRDLGARHGRDDYNIALPQGACPA